MRTSPSFYPWGTHLRIVIVLVVVLVLDSYEEPGMIGGLFMFLLEPTHLEPAMIKTRERARRRGR